MQKLGLVRIEQQENDRRKLCILLTEEGRRLENRLLPDIQILNDEVALKGFSHKNACQYAGLFR